MTNLDIRSATDATDCIDLSHSTRRTANSPTPAQTTPDLGHRTSDRLHRLATVGREALHHYRSLHSADLLEFEAIWGAMDAVSPWVMALSLWDLGWLRDSGQRITAEDVASRCCSGDRYQPLMSQWLEALANVGVVRRQPGETRAYAGELVDIDGVRDRIEQAVRSIDRATRYPGFIEYFKACISRQTDLLTGRANAQKLLFPAGSSRIVEGLYRTNPAAAMQNSIAAAVIRAVCHEWSQSRPMRILEVGAGTGATTTAILASLPTTELHYRFTDVSRFFIKRAARQFAQHPYVAYDCLDIDRPAPEQGFGERSFDIIVGANVLHTAKHIDQTLKHVQDLLSDDGILVAIETTSNTTLQMITFGHFEGVCHFQDHRRLSNLPFLSCIEWQSALRSAGLGNVAAVPSPEAGSRAWMQHVVFGARGSV